MADIVSKEKRSWNMSRIKGRDTGPEMKLRRYLFGEGVRYRVNYDVVGKPDIAFIGQKIAVFVHGCFWHLHGCENSVVPKTRRKFWLKKLNGNKSRDQKVRRALEAEGWDVIIVWECDIEQDVAEAARPIINTIRE